MKKGEIRKEINLRIKKEESLGWVIIEIDKKRKRRKIEWK